MLWKGWIDVEAEKLGSVVKEANEFQIQETSWGARSTSCEEPEDFTFENHMKGYANGLNVLWLQQGIRMPLNRVSTPSDQPPPSKVAICFASCVKNGWLFAIWFATSSSAQSYPTCSQVYSRFAPQAPPLALALPVPSAGLYASTPASLPRYAFTCAELKPFTDCSPSDLITSPIRGWASCPLLGPAPEFLCVQTLFGGCAGAGCCLGG